MLWQYQEFGSGRVYSDTQAEHMARDAQFMAAFDGWTDRFAQFVAAKGKVEPGPYRAYGFQRPSHRWADVKLAWRDASMRVGKGPEGSSVRRQHDEGLSRDAVLAAGKGEGERLRE